MSWMIIALVVVVIFAILALKQPQKQEAKPTELPYEKLDFLFSPAERSFLGVLNQAVGSNAQVFGKVRVADVITPKKGISRSDWQKGIQ